MREAEELFTAEDYVGLYDYLKSHQVYGQEGFKNIQSASGCMMIITPFERPVSDPAGAGLAGQAADQSERCKVYVLWAGKNILEERRGIPTASWNMKKTEEYYNDMKQDVAAALFGTFGMSEEELSRADGHGT